MKTNRRSMMRTSRRSILLVITTIGALLFLPMLQSTARAGVSFLTAKTTTAGGSGPSSVATGDFNGDGKPDMAIGNADQTVSVYLGNGDGTFQAPTNYVVSNQQFAGSVLITVGDFNSDGKTDLAAGSTINGTVSVLLGNGDGTFQPAITTSLPGRLIGSRMAAVDFNGDGKLDLFVAVASNPVAIWFLAGNGDGTFQSPVAFFNNFVAVATADFNNDGIPDVGLTDGNSFCSYLGTGGGNVAFAQCMVVRGGNAIFFGDMNGDGKPDAVIIGGGDGNVYVVPGNGDGTFGTRIVSAQFGSNTFSDAFLADVNHDGKLDVVATDAGFQDVTVLLGNGDSTLQSPLVYAVGRNPLELALADFNLDGNLDIVTTNNSENTFSTLLGNSDGTFQAAQMVLPIIPGVSAVPAVGDFNGDGKSDLAVGFGSGVFDFGISLANGSDTLPPLSSVHTPGRPICFMVAADFNNDGHLDLVAAQDVSATIFLGDGTGQFPSQFNAGTNGSSSACTVPQGIAVGDFNGDGKLDFVMANPLNSAQAPPGLLAQILGNGDGTFFYNGGFPVGTSPYSVASGDFNHDGILDMVAVAGDTSSNGASAYVLLGTGGGGAGSPVQYAAGKGPVSVAVGDFNRDGNLDFVVVNEGDSTLSVFLGNGNGTFQSPLTVAGSPQPTNANYVAVADFNGDGIPDLAVGAQGLLASGGHNDVFSGQVQIYLGKGDGTFPQSASFEIPGSSGAGSMLGQAEAIGDFNGDGAPDVAVEAGNTVAILLNTGGTFITLASSLNPSDLGNAVTFTANVTASIKVSGAAAPSGTVTFMDGSTALGTGTLSGGSATFTTSTLTGGTHTITAVYSGDSNFNPHTSSALTQTVLFPVVSLSSNSINFGNQGVGTTSPAQTVTLNNTGNGALNISSITISETDAPAKKHSPLGNRHGHVIRGRHPRGASSSDFAETDTCGSSVAAGASCTISVTFTPTKVGARAATLSLADNASDSPQTIALSGTGTAGLATLSTTSLTFGNQNVGTTSAAQTVTLSNTGNAALSISSIGIGGANAGDFAQTNNCGSSVGAGASCAITVTFTPTATGARTASVTITDNNNGVANSTQTVALTGTGTAPAVTLSPASLTFQLQLVGSSSKSKSVTLSNSGTGTLNITSIAITGVNSADFSETNSCGASVAAGASCAITVTFKPTAKGSRNASVSITDNAPGSPQSAALKGAGTVVSLSPASLNFGKHTVGTSTTKPVTLTNTGSTRLSIMSISISGTNSGDFTETNTCGASVAAGASCAINVTFTPAATGMRTATLSVKDNGGGNQQTVRLSGTGK